MYSIHVVQPRVNCMLYTVAAGLGVDLQSLCDLDALVPVEHQPEPLRLERGEQLLAIPL